MHLTSANLRCSLFTNHIDWRLDVISRNAWKHTRVHHPQTLCATHTELRIQHGHRVVVGSDLGGTARMVSPRTVLDPLCQLGLGLILGSGDNLCCALVGVCLVLLDDAASKLHSLDDGSKVVGPVTASGVEIIEIDARHVAGVVCH